MSKLSDVTNKNLYPGNSLNKFIESEKRMAKLASAGMMSNIKKSFPYDVKTIIPNDITALYGSTDFSKLLRGFAVSSSFIETAKALPNFAIPSSYTQATRELSNIAFPGYTQTMKELPNYAVPSSYAKAAMALQNVAVPNNYMKVIQSLNSKNLNELQSSWTKALRNVIPFENHLADSILTLQKSVKVSLEKSMEELKQKHPEYKMVLDGMTSLGWTVSDATATYVFDELIGKNAKDIDGYLLDYYSANGYELLFEELDNVISGLDKGYRKQLVRIKKILKDDINNYIIAIPILFSNIEYMFFDREGALNKDGSLSSRIVNREINNADEDEFIGVFPISLKSTLTVLAKIFKNGSKFEKGVDNSEYSRHSVLHGRYNPSRLNISMLVKLIVLMSSLNSLMPYSDGRDYKIVEE